MKQGMGILVVRKPPDKLVPAHCPWCGCKWGYIDSDVEAIKCGSCNRELKSEVRPSRG